MANPKNINSLQLLRNAELFASKDAAISQIKASATNDGTIKLARYEVSGTGDTKEVKTIFGIYYKGASGGSYTIYDSPQEVIEALEKKVSGNTEAIKVISGTGTGSIAQQITNAINDLDVTAITETGKAIVSVSQVDGKVSATAGTVAAEYVTIADTANTFTAGTVEGALAEINTKIDKAVTADTKVTLESVDGASGDTFVKAYTIKQGTREVGKINIPKDLVVTSGSVVKGNWVGGNFTENSGGTGTALKLVIANQAAPVYINTLDLVDVYTGENGINISDTNVVSIKLDTNTEGFLTVDADGLKLSGVQTAINKAKTEVVVDAEGHVTVTSKEKDGHLVYTIGENDIASEAALTAEIAARKAVDGIDGSAYTANASSKYISAASSLNDADVKLDAAISGVTEGVGFNENFRIAANPSGGVISDGITVSSALYTLDNAIAAAKKANTLSAKGNTPLTVESGASGTTISVNIKSINSATGETVARIVGYDADNKTFVYSDIDGIDAGTY